MGKYFVKFLKELVVESMGDYQHKRYYYSISDNNSNMELSPTRTIDVIVDEFILSSWKGSTVDSIDPAKLMFEYASQRVRKNIKNNAILEKDEIHLKLNNTPKDYPFKNMELTGFNNDVIVVEL